MYSTIVTKKHVSNFALLKGHVKEVVLIFPDTSAIADFLIKQKVSNAHVESGEQELTAVLSDRQIVVAETFYAAILKKMAPKN